jgi:hypothetical protein
MKGHAFAALVAATIMSGCAFLHTSSEETPAQAIPSHTNSAGDTHGYALLFNLLGDEKNVSKLLIIKARKSISKARAKELLTQSGKEFELRLLLSQNEALTYGAHLADVLAKAEPNERRANFDRGVASI